MLNDCMWCLNSNLKQPWLIFVCDSLDNSVNECLYRQRKSPLKCRRDEAARINAWHWLLPGQSGRNWGDLVGLNIDDLKGTVHGCNLRGGRYKKKLYTVPPPTQTHRSVLNHRMASDKEALCVGRRLRGVFGIPHTAAKINNQLFLHDWGKNKGRITVEGGNFFALVGAEGQEQ